jgi:DNA-binding NarL/FixJ family response regulator
LFEHAADIHVVGEADRPRYALTLAERLGAAVIVMDLDHHVADRLRLTHHHPDVESRPSIVGLTELDNVASLLSAIRVGVRALVYGDCEADELLQAIRVTARGHGWFPPEAIGQLLDLLAPRFNEINAANANLLSSLTAREREVVHLLACGCSNEEIARRLQMSDATVRSHVHHVLVKVGQRDRAQLVAYAYQTGLASLLSQMTR